MLVDCVWKVPKSHKLYPDVIRHGVIGYLYIGQNKGTKDNIRRPAHLLRSCESPLDGRLVDHPMQSQAVVYVEEERFPLRTNKCLSDSGHSSPSTI